MLRAAVARHWRTRNAAALRPRRRRTLTTDKKRDPAVAHAQREAVRHNWNPFAFDVSLNSPYLWGAAACVALVATAWDEAETDEQRRRREEIERRKRVEELRIEVAHSRPSVNTVVDSMETRTAALSHSEDSSPDEEADDRTKPNKTQLNLGWVAEGTPYFCDGAEPGKFITDRIDDALRTLKYGVQRRVKNVGAGGKHREEVRIRQKVAAHLLKYDRLLPPCVVASSRVHSALQRVND